MKLARRTSPCVACGAPIVVDTPIAPLLGQNGRIRWVHPACAPATPQPCPHWVRRGVCHLGDRCALAHPPLVDVPGAFAQAAFTKAGRVGVFRRFVVKEFGPAAVVDVAGGKGELSFELENLHDVACVVVDPRAPMLDDVSQRFRRFRARGFFDNNEGGLGFRRRWREHEEAGVELALRRPRHLRLFFDGALVDWTVSGGDDFFAAAARRWTREVLIGESSRKQNYAKRNGRLELLPPPPDLVAAPDDAWCATSARAALVGADLLVGLHCDGAAEPIIDFALAHGKAFAIVPCSCGVLYFSSRCSRRHRAPRPRRVDGATCHAIDARCPTQVLHVQQAVPS